MFEKLKFIIILFLFLATSFVSADEFTSTDYKVLEPVMFSGTHSSSTGYQLFGAISQISTGTSTSASFGINAGFLYFPTATTPVVSATAGDGNVALNWSVSQGYLGWTVSGYNVGQSTTSGGSYTYSSSLGNVTSSTRAGLTNGATYYFVIRVEDAFGNSIATSTEVSSTPTAPSGGGGGGGYIAPVTGVVFSGRAYPKSIITVLKDAQIAAQTLADPAANFRVAFSGLSAGSYIFGIYSEDSQGIRSMLLTFPVTVTLGITVEMGGIFIAPTITVEKSEAKRGENIAIFGQSAPKADVTVAINSEEEFFGKTIADATGAYLYNLDTAQLEKGQHLAKSKAIIGEAISPFSKTVVFTVGTKTVFAAPEKAPEKEDLNNDKKVNLVDFSIIAYWYNRPSPPASIDLNKDGKINLVDFSILAFYWTG